MEIPRLCPLNIKFLCFPVDDDVVPSFSPLRDSSGILSPSVTSCPSPLSFLPICPLSARLCVFSRPPQCLVPPGVRPPSSGHRKATNPPASVDQCPLLFSRPSAPYAGLHPPPRPVRLVVLGLGVGGGSKETAPPAMVLSPSSRRQASPASGQVHAYARRSISLLILAVPAVVLSPSSRRQASPVQRTSACLLQPDARFPS